MHAKYEASISYGSKVIANVKVDNRQTNRFQSQNASAKQKPLPQFLFSDRPKKNIGKGHQECACCQVSSNRSLVETR